MYTPRYLAKFEKHTKYKLWVYHSLQVPVPLDTFIILVCIYIYVYLLAVCTHQVYRYD